MTERLLSPNVRRTWGHALSSVVPELARLLKPGAPPPPPEFLIDAADVQSFAESPLANAPLGGGRRLNLDKYVVTTTTTTTTAAVEGGDGDDDGRGGGGGGGGASSGEHFVPDQAHRGRGTGRGRGEGRGRGSPSGQSAVRGRGGQGRGH